MSTGSASESTRQLVKPMTTSLLATYVLIYKPHDWGDWEGFDGECSWFGRETLGAELAFMLAELDVRFLHINIHSRSRDSSR